MMKLPLISGDTTAVIQTGLKKIYSYSFSLPSVTAKALNFSTVSGGTISATFTDPAATAYLFVTAIGI